MVRIVSTQHKLQVNVLIKLAIHSTFKTGPHELDLLVSAWAPINELLLSHPSERIQLLVTLDLDPAACPQSPTHRRITDHYTEVFPALLRDEGLVERLGLVGLRARMLISLVIAFFCAIIIAVESLVYSSIIVCVLLVQLVMLYEVLTTMGITR